MDNSEGYGGLSDLSSLFNALGDSAKASYYATAATSMQNGILSMWMNGNWAVYKNWYGQFIAPNMGTWYADASSQVFPVLMGVVSSSDPRAQQAYAALNAAWPAGPSYRLIRRIHFPGAWWSTAPRPMGDQARVATYINNVQSKYVNSGFPWPFYNAEAGWFMRANNYMLGHGL